MKTPVRRSGCPISYFTDIFGDKWTLIVLRDLLIANKTQFKQLLMSDERISSNILSDRLCRLECGGFITRQQDPSKKNQTIYMPTEKCKELKKVIIEIAKWSVKQDSQSPVPQMASDRGYKTCDLFIEESISNAVDSSTGSIKAVNVED